MAKQQGAGVIGGDIVVEYLIKEKVPYVFGVPGHGIFGLMEALDDRKDQIKSIGVHHEQAAGHMADAYYRVAHRPVATFTSCGPGSTNIPMALANAMMDASAFLAITGNVATSQFGRGAFQETYRYYQADYPSVIRPYVKRSFQVTRTDMLPFALRQAFKTMTTGRPGPVNIDIPYNVFMEDAGEVEVPDPGRWREGIDTRMGASPEAVQRALEALVAAERPVILAGNGAVLSEAEQEVRAVAEALNIPVANTALGIGVMAPDHPLALGPIGRDGSFPASEATRSADVILALGAEFDDLASSSWIPGYTFSIPPTKLIQVDIDESAIGRNYPVYLGLNADVRTFLKQLLSLLEREEHGGDHAKWEEDVAAWKGEWKQFNEDRLPAIAKPMHPQHIIRPLRKVLPREGIVVTGVGIMRAWLTQQWESYLPRTVIQPWGFGAMGFAAAGALGAQLAAPDRPVVSVCGDGGFLMVSHVVATAVEFGIPVTWVIWNNSGYGGMFRTWGRGLHSRFKHESTGEPFSPDYAALARALGADGIRVDQPGDVGDALESAVKSDRPTVVEVIAEDPEPQLATVGTWHLPPRPYPEPSYRQLWEESKAQKTS